ncbi:YbaB/EbfC family nucleoid-associated protein [Nocardia sp. NEAU-G5]|uniref:YbaB/EbfC family nucleoid-associated protein n=1 Tax=Nocardia albiluteola TaxID=2842303 RepID=A0ABS6BCT1_9NOCA|nr:YbaB/EbfC family nucleoid-associated protein [Nocardia albiluteola]MBU3068089.1 YbaB/EbfC family nucleoid-associated protein [Nocardia albiluteola]
MVRHNTRLIADTAEVLDGIHEVITSLADARARCRALTVTATAERGSITVMADGSGALAGIEFAYDTEQLGYTRLARSTVQAAQAAGAEVRRRADAIMTPLRERLERLPGPAEVIHGLPARGAIPPPPPALLTPPGARDPAPGTDGARPHPALDTSCGPAGPAADLVRLQQARTVLVATGTAEQRRVAVTVNADCLIVDIQFSSGIADLDHDDIAEAILAASRAAVAEVARRVQALFAPVTYDRSGFPGVAETLAGLENLRDQLR